VGIYQCDFPNGQKIFLVDTPGFDDTSRSDTDVLREVVKWLNDAYSKEIILCGIIYLHRIRDDRMGGAAMRNLSMFNKMCGEEGLGSVILATTFWAQVSDEEGTRKETLLKTRPDFWKRMVDRGSTVMRQDCGAESAQKIVQFLIDKRRPRALEIQKDMVDRHMTLDQTAAGQELQIELARQRVEYERKMNEIQSEMQQAIDKKDKEHQDDLAVYKKEMDAKIAKVEEDKKLIVSTQKQLSEQIEQQRRQQEQQRQQQEQQQERDRNTQSRPTPRYFNPNNQKPGVGHYTNSVGSYVNSQSRPTQRYFIPNNQKPGVGYYENS